MKKAKILFILILALLNSLASCQQVKNQHFTTKEVDKVVLSTVYFKDKTTEPQILKKDSVTKLYYPSDTEPKEIISKTGSANLNKDEIKKLESLLQTPNSGHALPYQYDIQLDFYNRGKVFETATMFVQNYPVKTEKEYEMATNKMEIDSDYKKFLNMQGYDNTLLAKLDSREDENSSMA